MQIHLKWRRCGLLVLMLAGIAVHGSALAETVPADGAPATVLTIRLSGNTVLGDAQLRPILASFEGRPLADEELEDLRQQITRAYIDAGYINSGALIPARADADGVLLVQIIEGRLSEVNVSGPHHYRAGYLARRISPRVDAPLNVRTLQERMQLLLQDGVVEQVNADLAPGAEPGLSILNAAVREGPRFGAALSLNNERPPSVGEYGGTLALSARNLLGINDASAISGGLTRGYESYGIQETLPLWGPLSLFLSAAKDHGDIVESSIRELDITSRQVSAEAGFSAQLIHSLQQSLGLSLSTYYSETETFLLGMPFSFTAGVQDGRSTVAGIRVALDWIYRGESQVFAARSVVNNGIDAYGATINTDRRLPDSRYTVWNGQFQYLRQWWGRTAEFVARGGAQRSSRGLLPSEKFSLGGVSTVRGYAVNTLVRDQGAVGSVEYRHRLFDLKVPGISRKSSDGALRLAAFFDGGTAGDRDGQREWLSSVGTGLRWDPAENFSAVVYKGFALHDRPSGGDSLQDHGVAFEVAYELRF